MSTIVLDHRYPSIRIQRDHFVEWGAELALYWNGSRAPNGDGFTEGGAIDYTSPIVVQRLWPEGLQLSLFGGAFGEGGFADAKSGHDPQRGFAMGPFGQGPFGVGASYWSWKTSFPWRNGTYSLAARLRDRLGNEQTTASATLTIQIAALPRAVPSVAVAGVKLGALQLKWKPSPDFDVTE